MYKNTIGLEAEYFVRNGKGDLVIPSTRGLETDDYEILGEFRGECGTTRAEVLANFMKSFYDTYYRVINKKLQMDIETGWACLSTELHAKVLRTMGSKEISEAKNIYDTDILELSDAIIEKNKVVGYNASIGLHVHFNSSDVSEHERKVDIPQYEEVSLPIGIGDAETTLKLYRYVRTDTDVRMSVSARANRITNPVIKHIVTSMDELLPNYKLEPTLKFRQPGYYECKSHGGFEYRSLPFNKAVLDALPSIVDYAFTLLEEL